MKSFHVFRHPTNGLAAVKIGVSWPASFLGVFWLLRHRLWKVVGLSIAAYILLSDAKEIADPQYLRPWLIAVGWVAICFAPFIKGNSWREANLKSRGYEILSTVEADTPDEAITQVKFARAAAAENELWASAKTSHAPEGFDMGKMIEPPTPKPYVSRRNTPWGIEAEIRQRFGRRRRGMY
jgi:hypothetical protein